MRITSHAQLAIALSVLTLTVQIGSAQETAIAAKREHRWDDVSKRGSDAYEEAADALREMGPQRFQFKKAKLADVVTLVADEAGLNYICLLGSQTAGENLVTFSLSVSPFRALESLAKHFPITMMYDEGVWVISADEPKLSAVELDESQAKTLSTFGLGDFKRDTSHLGGIRVGDDIVISRDAVLFSKRKFDVEPEVKPEPKASDSLTLDAPVESLIEELSPEEPKR